MKYYKKLIGERIYLSPVSVEDAEKYVEWFCDFKTTDGIGKSSSIMTVESEREWLENTLKNNDLNFAIVDLENDELIGACGLNYIDWVNRNADLSIYIGIGDVYIDEKFAPDATKLLLDYGFNYLNMNNIMLNVKSFNERAIACYKKVGFKEFGRRRESYFLNGKYYDDIQMDFLAREFKGDYIKNKNI